MARMLVGRQIQYISVRRYHELQRAWRLLYRQHISTNQFLTICGNLTRPQNVPYAANPDVLADEPNAADGADAPNDAQDMAAVEEEEKNIPPEGNKNLIFITQIGSFWSNSAL